MNPAEINSLSTIYRDETENGPGWIHFYDNPNLYKMTRTIGHTTDNMFPGRMCSRGPNNILYLNHPGGVTNLHCASSPRGTGTSFQDTIPCSISDMCCTHNASGTLLIVGSGNLSAYNCSFGKAAWFVNGAIGNMDKEMCIGSVTTDRHGHIFVCDWANSSIHKFSTDGVYLGCVLKAGEAGFGKPCRLRWCLKTSSLVIVHKKNDLFYIGALILNC